MLGLMTLKELSKELQKPESTIRTWRRRGDLPSSLFKEIGGTVFVRVEKLKEWIDNEP
jgi:hypothetical protein